MDANVAVSRPESVAGSARRGRLKSAISATVSVDRVALGATWLLVFAWAVSSLWYPFGWDQGIMAWVGRTILDGGMPYRDAFDIKGPAAHYIFAIAQALFGQNTWGIRVLDLLGLAAAGWLIARSARRLTGAAVGSWAAAVFVLWFAGLTFWHTAQPDGFAAMLLCLAVLPLFDPDADATTARGARAGLLLGLTVAIKPLYAAFAIVPLILWWMRTRSARRSLGPAIALTAAMLAVVVGVLAWFAHRGALGPLIEAHLIYNAQAYSSGASLAAGPRLRGLIEYALAGKGFVLLLPAACYGALRLGQTDRAAAWALVGWAVVAAGSVMTQNKFFAYQWAPLFPPVVVLAAAGLQDALAHRSTTPRPALARVLAALILVHVAVHPMFEVANWASYIVGARDKPAYYDTFGVPGPDLRMTEYITANSTPDDRLIVMGWNIEILYTSRRPTMSRLAYSLPVWMGEGTALRQKYRDELMRDLRRTPPELILVAPQAEPLLGREVALDEFPEFTAFLAERYRPVHREGSLVLYRR